MLDSNLNLGSHTAVSFIVPPASAWITAEPWSLGMMVLLSNVQFISDTSTPEEASSTLFVSVQCPQTSNLHACTLYGNLAFSFRAVAEEEYVFALATLFRAQVWVSECVLVQFKWLRKLCMSE